MKKIDLNLIKDIIISVLIVTCIVLILVVIFYNKTGLTKFIPEAEEYNMSEEMQNDFTQTVEQEDNTIIKYKLDSSDLKQVEKTNEYDKGKKNPFSEFSEGVNNGNITTGVVDKSTQASENETFYEDDGTK